MYFKHFCIISVLLSSVVCQTDVYGTTKDVNTTAINELVGEHLKPRATIIQSFESQKCVNTTIGQPCPGLSTNVYTQIYVQIQISINPEINEKTVIEIYPYRCVCAPPWMKTT